MPGTDRIALKGVGSVRKLKLTPAQILECEAIALAELWWRRDGTYLDPEPDADWYDKRGELAQLVSACDSRKAGLEV